MTEPIDFGKMGGLVPAVVQDAHDGAVLMLGFMNEEAYRQTLRDREVVFWSRSKQHLWKKGETSGNILDLVSMEPDCDSDALLVKAIPRGPVCHTGERSCFKGSEPAGGYAVLDNLISTIRRRKKELPEKSYTADPFKRGVLSIGQKVGEEGVELALAAQYQDKKRCIEEGADLLYHTLVLLEAKEIGFDQVLDELRTRMKPER